MSKSGLNMGEGRVLPVLVRLGAPSMVSMLFQNLYALVDTVFVSWLGTVELAALALSVPLLFIGLSLSKGVAVGATALMSHAYGSGDREHAANVCASAYPLALLVLGPLCLFALPAVNQSVFGLFAVGSEVLEHVDRFVFWLALSFPLMGLALVCEGIFLSNGDSRTPMLAMIVGNVVNIGLDPLFIFALDMGIAGASLASLIGWGTSAGIMLWRLKRRDMERPKLLCSRSQLRFWAEIARCGTAVTLAMLVMPLGTAGLNAVLARYGAAYVGAWTLSVRIEQLVSMPLIGLSYSLVPFVAFNLGRGLTQRVQEARGACLKLSYLLVVLMGVPLFIFIDAVLRLFSPGAEVHALAAFSLRVALVGYLIAPVEMVMIAIAQGIKRSGYTLAIFSIRLLVLRIPLALVLGYALGGRGVYLSHPVSLILTGLVSILLLRRLIVLIEDKSPDTTMEAAP